MSIYFVVPASCSASLILTHSLPIIIHTLNYMPPNIEFLGISTTSVKFTYGNHFFVKFSSILSNNFEQETDTYAKVYMPMKLERSCIQ